MQMFSVRIGRTVAIVLLLFAGLMATPRADAAQDPVTFISNLGTQGMDALRTGQDQRFRQLLETNFDLPAIGRFVLGPYSRMLSPAEFQTFVPLFGEYLARVYTTRLQRYADAPFRVVETKPYGAATVVTSQVGPTGGGSPVRIDWYVENSGGRPLVTDVVVDGVSMKVTQRGEFASIIQRNGGNPQALLAVLRQQLAEAR